MRVFKGFDNLPKFNNAVVTLGSFDGVHCGHIALLNKCTELAQSVDGESVVLTFEIHPRVVLGRSEGLRLLMTLEEKISVLEEHGVDNLIVIPFDRDFSRLSHDEFVKRYLVELLGVRCFVAGYNHHLGRGSEGGYSSFVKLSEEYGFDICRVDEWCDVMGNNVSSTVVRSLVARGDIDRVTSLLSRPYRIVAQVDSEGRVWSSDALKLFPAEGEYRVSIDGVPSQIRVDSSGAMWCQEEGQKRITIDILERL